MKEEKYDLETTPPSSPTRLSKKILARRHFGAKKGCPTGDANLACLQKEPFHRRVKIIRESLKILASSQAPSFKLISYFNKLANSLSLAGGTISLIPGHVNISFETVDSEESFYSFGLKIPGGLNMEKLELIEIVLENISLGYYSSVDACLEELEWISKLDSPWGKGIKILAFGGLCLGAAPMFGGNAIDAIISAIIGCLFGAIMYFSEEKLPNSMPVFDFWSSALLSLLTRGICQIALLFKGFGPDSIHPIQLNYFAIFLPAIIWILPGFSMINGFIDFLYGNRALGISNIFNAFFTAFDIALGMFIGFYSLFPFTTPLVRGDLGTRGDFLSRMGELKLVGTFFPQAIAWLPRSIILLVLFLSCIFFISLTFDATAKQIPYVLLFSSLAFMMQYAMENVILIPKFLESVFDWSSLDTKPSSVCPWVIPDPVTYWVGGLIAGLFSSIFSRCSRFSSTPLIYTGIVVLAPGAVGARGVFFMLRGNWQLGLETIFNMFAISFCIAIGTILGRVITFNKK